MIRDWSCVECGTTTGPAHSVDVDYCVPCFVRVATEEGYVERPDGVWVHPEGVIA